MASDHYRGFIEEAFIHPIRSVLIIDDDYPTYDDILQGHTSASGARTTYGSKAYLTKPEQIADVIASFRQRSQPLLVDIHDGAKVSSEAEAATAAHLHQCDLLVLDYELDKGTPGDGTRAIDIVRRVMSNDHFNLIVIHTKEYLDVVFNAVRWGLIPPSDDTLSETDGNSAADLLDQAEESCEGLARDLSESVDAAQYFHSRQYPSTHLRTMVKAQQPYTLFASHADRAGWCRDQRRLVLRYLLDELERRHAVGSASEDHVEQLEWSANSTKWIRADSAFVALASKKDCDADLLSQLLDALTLWNPPPSRLFFTKLRAEIDEYGVVAQGPALSNRHALAYWYHRLLASSGSADRRWRVSESVSRHSRQLMTEILPGVTDFATRLVEADIASGDPAARCKDHFDVDLGNSEDKTKAVLEHNVSVCSMKARGWHLTTGHVFSVAGKEWLCLSPACDMVPSPVSEWDAEMFGDHLPFVAVKLRRVSSTSIPPSIQSNRFVFLDVVGETRIYCFNDQEGSAPKWHMFYAENRGELSSRDLRFTVSFVQQDGSTLTSESLEATVIGQLRYEYALNLIQKLGVSLTRVGLDLSDGRELTL